MTTRNDWQSLRLAAAGQSPVLADEMIGHTDTEPSAPVRAARSALPEGLDLVRAVR